MKILALDSVRKKVFLLDMLVLLAKVDGKIHDREKELISSFSYSIGGKEVSFSENYSLKDVLNMAPLLEKSEKFIIIKKLYELAASDFDISKEEEDFISEICYEFGLSHEDQKIVSKWAEGKMILDKELDDYISMQLVEDL